MFRFDSLTRVRRRLCTAAKLTIAGALLSVAVAAPAQAHALSVSSAESSARWHGEQIVNSEANDYVGYEVVACKSLFPHIAECRIGFDNRATKSTNRYACAERIQVFYKAHSEIPPSNPKKFWKYVTHGC